MKVLSLRDKEVVRIKHLPIFPIACLCEEMENKMPIVVTIPYKMILKELLKKLHLLLIIYECENSGPEYQPIFIAKVIFENSFVKYI